MKYNNTILFIILFTCSSLFGSQLSIDDFDDSCKISYDSIKDEEQIYIADEIATYIGGEQKLFKDIRLNFIYPRINDVEIVNCRILFSFTINADGKISHFKIIRPKEIPDAFRKSLMDIQNHINNWIPAKCNGKAVATKFYLPMNICLNAW